MPPAPGWHQLMLTGRGALRARTDAGEWVAPRDRAIVLPAGSVPRVALAGRMAVRVLYLAQSAFAAPAPGPRVIAVGPLLRELVLDAVARAPLDLADPRSAALMALIVADLGVAPELPLHLPWPRDPRARAVAEALVADHSRSPADLAPTAGLSRRTLERCFSSETGLSPAGWQRRARVTAALVLLAEGRPVTQTALDVGYATPSAFTAAFRRELGRTPRTYLSPPPPPR